MPVPAVLAIVGLIILAGFGGKEIFRRTRIPDIPILLGIGVLLGPVLHLVEPPLLLPIAPFLGTLALLVIMLEGGMSLELDRVLRQMKWALLLTVATFTLTMWAIAGAYWRLTGLPLTHTLLLGGILGCTSGAIIIPLVQEMRISQNARTLLTLEAALGDALAVVSVLVLIRYIQLPTPDLGLQIQMMASAFLWGAILGGIGGLLWARLLARLGRIPLAYMLTMAVIFLVYSACEAIHSSGVFAVLVFGTAIANTEEITRRFPSWFGKVEWETAEFSLHQTVRWFHEEVTFVARVFFFVFLGMLLDLQGVTLRFLGIGGALVVIVYLARFLTVRSLGWFGRRQPPFERRAITWLAPRGLASAVLAVLPSAAGLPGTEDFILYTFFAIAATNAVLTLAVIRSERHLEEIIEEQTAGSEPKEYHGP